MQLQLATTRVLNGHTLNCYTDKEAQNPLDFFATRRQIGEFLGYAEPNDAVKKIHQRNKERLDTFSTIVNLGGAVKSGGQFVPDLAKNIHPTTIYSFKGLLEICRFSNQPNANKVIDILWNIAEEIRQKGYYLPAPMQEKIDALTNEVKRLMDENAMLRAELQEGRKFRILGESIALMPGGMTIGEVAKILRQHGINIGQNRAFKKCREEKMLCKRKGCQQNQPTQKAIEKGYFTININIGAKGTPMMTPKGFQWFTGLYTSEQFPLLAVLDEGDDLDDSIVRKQA